MFCVNLRNRVSIGISRHPTQKLVETRFLAPGVNLRNRVDLAISRHPTQKLKDVKWVLYCRLGNCAQGQQEIVRTGWIVEPGSNEARLVTLFVRR
ncbi:DUF6883 domain-containing protein [Microcoleus sp. bin38.metabat.b11b12b14.051]|uniref:DUF6883 domain-containing protein n=1 Tax=Microcoleus sp. bin38.metabat.b11b12b14.051 TaxID=2742709 RepID=UPI0034585899